MATLTHAGPAPLTPICASPEQINGEEVATPSDVYGLGTLLYRLLAGHFPHQKSTRQQHLLAHAICFDEAMPPSKRVMIQNDWDQSSPRALAKVRNTNPKKLAKILKGDLDAVLAKALAKDPGKRYRSADLLADDLCNYLKGYPVLARQGGAPYRTVKTITRHKASFAVGLCGLLLIASYLFTLHLQSQRMALEKEKSQRVSTFLIDMLRSADPQYYGADVKLMSLIDDFSDQTSERLDDLPDVHVRVNRVLGETYLRLGQMDRAEPLLHEAMEIAARELPTGHVERYKLHAAIAERHHKSAHYEEALSEIDWAIAKAAEERSGEDLPPEEDPSWRYRFLRAEILVDMGQFEKADHDLTKLEAEIASLVPPAHRLRIQAGKVRADYLYERKSMNAAADKYLDVIEDMRAVLGHDHPETLITEVDYLEVFHMGWNTPEYERICKELITRSRTVFGEEHSMTSRAKAALGMHFMASGDAKQAGVVWQNALDGLKASVGETHLATLKVMGRLATAKLALGEIEASIDLRNRAQLRLDKNFGAGHPEAILNREHLLKMILDTGNTDEAEQLLRSNLIHIVETHGEDHYLFQRNKLVLAKVKMKRDEPTEAERLVREVIAQTANQNDIRYIHLRAGRDLVRILRLQGRLAEARDNVRENYQGWIAYLGPDNEETQTTRELYLELSRLSHDEPRL
jgi:serine/threonine-protein kinase